MLATEFPLSRPWAGGPVVLWGGELPSGSLKYLTFLRHLESMPDDAQGLVELSGSSTALALGALGMERGLPVVAVTDAEGRAHLRAQGFQGEVHTVRGMDHAWALAQGYERRGWYWPRQLANGALVDCVEAWASRLGDVVRAEHPDVRSVVCGFGTGATVVGLHRALSPSGYDVVGLQPMPGRSLPGWRRWKDQNLGEADLFYPHHGEVLLEEAHGGGADCLGALLTWAREQPEPESVLIVAHNAKPCYG